MQKLTKLSIILMFLVVLFMPVGIRNGATQAQEASEPLLAESSAPLAVCTPDTPDMVAYWPFDDGDGATTFDDLVADPGNEATCGLACPESIAGKISTAFNFANDEVTVPDDGLADSSFDFAADASLSFEMLRRVRCGLPLDREWPLR